MVRSIKNRIKCEGSQGFTLFELLIVVSLMSVLVVIAGGSLSTVTAAKAISARDKMSALLSQSKISALSGEENRFELEYNADDDCYVCSIVYLKYNNHENRYDVHKTVSEIFGNSNLKISVVEMKPNNIDVKSTHDLIKADGSSNGKVVVKFNKESGAVETFTFDNANINNNSCNVFNAQSRGSCFIKLYRDTGSQITE